MQEKYSVLLIDNDSENFSRVEKLAELFDLNYLQAPSANAALHVLEGEAVAVVIVHPSRVSLPGFIEKLRDDEHTREVPVLVTCGQPERVNLPDEGAPVELIPPNIAFAVFKTRFRVLYDWFVFHQKISDLEAENKQLTSMNKRIRKFVGNVAHDLRGPLGKLINTSDILLSGVEPDAVEPFYNILSQTSRRGFNLVNDLLDITALESGQVRLNPEDCDLQALAKQVITELGYLAVAKEIKLENRMIEPLVVKADSRRVFQVLGNLLNNAVKFTARKGTITLLAISEEAGVRISVCDTGVGIPEEKMGDLFLKHEKVSTPGTEGEPGTGFGLALAQEIIQGHGSTIEVDSQLGKGSCFSFVLPLWA